MAINKTRYAILGVLSHEAASGYDIKKFCDSSISYFWNENYAHIYPVLKQLEDDGLVVKRIEQNEGRPPKNVYSITEAGRKELDKWLMIPVEDFQFRNELLLKLFFSDDVPNEIILDHINGVRERHIKELASYGNMEDMLSKNAKNEKGLPLWMATLSYGRLHAEAMLKWCEEAEELLKNRGK